jgi:hypothetical protein
MLDHHINDGALTPRQGHEQCEGALPPYSQHLFIYLFIYLTRIEEFF